MSAIDIGPDQIEIDAEIVANALKLTPQDLQVRMREGTVTSACERGEGEDDGRYRLTFFSATRRARITANSNGTILSCTSADFSRRPRAVGPAAIVTSRTSSNRQTLDAMLDDALNETFPASDPVALNFDRSA